MKTRHVTILLVALFLVCCGAEAAITKLDPAVADSIADATSDPLVKADVYSDSWQFKKIVSMLEKEDQNNPEVLWRLARARIDLGEEIDNKDALVYYEKALEEAEKAVELDPENALAHQTVSVAAGRVALYKGVFKSIGLVKKVRNHATMAIAKNDSVPIALYVLGRTHKKLLDKSGLVRKPLGLGWAKKDSAKFYFDKAIEVSGDNMIQCHIEYAELLIEKFKDYAGAKQQLEAAQALPLRDANDEKALKRIDELMKKIK